MWVINRALKEDGYHTIPMILQGDMVIDSVRLFSDDAEDGFSMENVYVGRLEDFFFMEPGLVLLASGNDMLFVEDGDLTRVFNCVIHIFDRYRSWASRIARASYDGVDPFQRMLDVIHEEFRCPMFFGKKDMSILAITSQYTDKDVYDGWDDVVAHRTFPVYMFQKPRPKNVDQYSEELPIAAIPAKDFPAWRYDYQIRCNCYCAGTLWGHFYVLYNHGARLDNGVLQLARYCGDCYGELLDRGVARDKTFQYERFLLLRYAIEGEPIRDAQMENIYMQMRWAPGTELGLYLLSFPAAYGLERESLCAYICEVLEKHITDQLVFPYLGQILIVAPYGQDIPVTLLRYVQLSLLAEKYICGVSYPFRDLNALRFAYFQARFAVMRFAQTPREADEGRMAYYADWAFAGLIQYMKDGIEWKHFVAPDLLKLYELDQHNGTEYYRTLFFYLLNNGRMDTTAKQMFIHRNTLKYRMDKIQQLITQDLNDSDQKEFLKLCYSMMLEEWPLRSPNGRSEN